MSFDIFENLVSLLCTIVGLLYCVFKYIETPKRGYRCLIVFFLANFLSEYYWTNYQLVMRSYPDVSEFVAYIGWNVGYLFLMLAAFFMRREESKRFIHPVILLPILTNIPQLFLYISYGGVLNNVWEVGTTTLAMVFAMQELAYYIKNRKTQKAFPFFSVFVLAFLVTTYGMWTLSCFNFGSVLLDPWFYTALLNSVLCIFLVYGARKHYDSEGTERVTKDASELRFQVLIQAVVTLVIIGICAAGFFASFGIKESLSNSDGIFTNERHLVIYLFVISAVLILLILALIVILASRYRRIMAISKKMNVGKRGRLNLISTIAVTLALMVFAVVYNNVVLYNAAVVSVYEDGDEAIKTTATELENYLTVAMTTLRVAADSVDLMEKNGSSTEEITKYIMDQTDRQSKQFDENFTGIYAYINGKYLDGLGWVPPEGYEPTERDWYKTAAGADGEIVIVSPYVDAQTGEVVITIAKSISDAAAGSLGKKNVVCLDVIVNHIQEVTENVKIAGKGYGMVVNTDGFIIAHRDRERNGENLTEKFDRALLDSILNASDGMITAKIGDEDCTLFVAPVMERWYSVIVIGNTELMEDTYSQLALSVMVSLVTFFLILFFYYIGYKNEQIFRHKVEEMNLDVVSALAAAIDAKDNYTNGHSSRVAEYSRMIAARSGYSKQEQDEVYMIGLLHDVGKIGIPDEVINKPSKLTDEEYELIRKHPVIGNSILGSIKERPNLSTGARYHHERYDGSGYPDGLAGEKIPEIARIIAVADAYDAMTSRRSYRDVMPQDKVLEEIRKGIGTQFDPAFAGVMIDMIEADPDYTMREHGKK